MTAGRGRGNNASRPRRDRRGRIGLALAGGGPLGGIYEVGTLLALADSLEGVDFNALEVYVGVSSGSFVAAALANGISPAQMYRLFIENGRDAALKPEIFLKPAFREFGRRLMGLPRLGVRAGIQYLRDPLHRGAMESLATLSRAVPTGMFDNRAIDDFLAKLFAAPGRSNDFRRLAHRLFLVATNLDTGGSVAFGTPGQDHVPISRAIQASSALPALFPPVEIDGAHYVDGALNKTLHASLALNEGVDLLLCINPLVPFDARSARRSGRVTEEKLHRGGLPLVLSQTFRAIIHSRMKVGMEKYATRYPGADILLFEPAREDVDMFFAKVFSYAQRRKLCALAFDSTRDYLREQAPGLAPLLVRHGLRLRAERIADRQRQVTDAVTDPRPLHAGGSRRRNLRRIGRDLDRTLAELEREVETLRARRAA
ncbi:MAG TPA: patatin-like phospholipase family protein [Casimicrobiaceae bacterium]|nr:patatin-like phospholipase family protein [Casimicrobiaceae bacterium]